MTGTFYTCLLGELNSGFLKLGSECTHVLFRFFLLSLCFFLPVIVSVLVNVANSTSMYFVHRFTIGCPFLFLNFHLIDPKFGELVTICLVTIHKMMIFVKMSYHLTTKKFTICILLATAALYVFIHKNIDYIKEV